MPARLNIQIDFPVVLQYGHTPAGSVALGSLSCFEHGAAGGGGIEARGIIVRPWLASKYEKTPPVPGGELIGRKGEG